MSAAAMKARMRGDLVEAMKARRTEEVSLLRSLLAAIDNAEAPPAVSHAGSTTRGPTEVERLALSEADLQSVVAEEVRSCEQAAAELDRVGQGERARILSRQAAFGARYLEQT